MFQSARKRRRVGFWMISKAIISFLVRRENGAGRVICWGAGFNLYITYSFLDMTTFNARLFFDFIFLKKKKKNWKLKKKIEKLKNWKTKNDKNFILYIYIRCTGILVCIVKSWQKDIFCLCVRMLISKEMEVFFLSLFDMFKYPWRRCFLRCVLTEINWRKGDSSYVYIGLILKLSYW